MAECSAVGIAGYFGILFFTFERGYTMMEIAG